MPPGPPVLELKEAKGSTISLVWTPVFEGDSPITGYYLESKTTNGDLWTKPVFASKQSVRFFFYCKIHACLFLH